MRLNLISFFCVAATLVAPAYAAPRPPLAKEMIFSADQIVDLDSHSDNAEDQILFGAVETLIEEFAVNGITYADKGLHKDWEITADEAKILLVSVYESLAGQANGAIDSLLYETPKDDAGSVTAAAIKSFERATNPTPACRILMGTEFAVPAGKLKRKPLAANAHITWEQAVACFPGASLAPVSMKAYDRKNAVRGQAITRGEFIHKLNVAASNSIANFSGAIY